MNETKLRNICTVCIKYALVQRNFTIKSLLRIHQLLIRLDTFIHSAVPRCSKEEYYNKSLGESYKKMIMD